MNIKIVSNNILRVMESTLIGLRLLYKMKYIAAKKLIRISLGYPSYLIGHICIFSRIIEQLLLLLHKIVFCLYNTKKLKNLLFRIIKRFLIPPIMNNNLHHKQFARTNLKDRCKIQRHKINV